MEELMMNYWSSDDDSTLADNLATDEPNVLSKKNVERLRRFETIKEWRKTQRRLKKERTKSLQNGGETTAEKRPTKAELREEILARLEFVQSSHTTPKVCVDMGLGYLMNQKEIDRLSTQVRFVYGSNRRAGKPLHLTFSNLVAGSPILEACLRRNDGFSQYRVDMTNQSFMEVFPIDKITYLTPDSDIALKHLEIDQVYVIGGLVDESPNKDYTRRLAAERGISTARLPINEYLKQGSTGSYNKILSVNQIFDILLSYHFSGDWTAALMSGIPKRKGFLPR